MFLLSLLILGCGPKIVSFKTQIQPILTARCTSCHSGEKPRGKISLASYASMMSAKAVSGKGPLVIPGGPYQSRLYIVCSTNQPQFRMPPDTTKIPALSTDELTLLIKWINQGAKDN